MLPRDVHSRLAGLRLVHRTTCLAAAWDCLSDRCAVLLPDTTLQILEFPAASQASSPRGSKTKNTGTSEAREVVPVVRTWTVERLPALRGAVSLFGGGYVTLISGRDGSGSVSAAAGGGGGGAGSGLGRCSVVGWDGEVVREGLPSPMGVVWSVDASAVAMIYDEHVQILLCRRATEEGEGGGGGRGGGGGGGTGVRAA